MTAQKPPAVAGFCDCCDRWGVLTQYAGASLCSPCGAEAKDAEQRRDLRRRIDAVLAVCDRHERGALRWADPLPVPEWIAEVREAAGKDSQQPSGGAA